MNEQDAEAVARAWLVEMESCVRGVDYARARAIFAVEVVAFGSRAAMLAGLDELERDQWRQVWGDIRQFTFLTDRLEYGTDGADLVWIACKWSSQGRDAGGNWTDRPGRMTAVIRRDGNRWVAVHTHHSLAPVA